MKTNDGVSTAFEMILEEIDSVVSEVNSQGAACLRNNEYKEVRRAIEAGEKLQAFRSKLESLKSEWVTDHDEQTRHPVKIKVSAVAKTIASAPKAPKTVLRVRFGDGMAIHEPIAAHTLVKSIKKLGTQRVIALGEEVYGFPMITKEKHESYTQAHLDGYFVTTHSSTEDKRKKLLKIAGALKEKISVDIVAA